ncbi:MAG: hypothetical protein AAF467_13250 [Actinomycetota bacterium]
MLDVAGIAFVGIAVVVVGGFGAVKAAQRWTPAPADAAWCAQQWEATAAVPTPDDAELRVEAMPAKTLAEAHGGCTVGWDDPVGGCVQYGLVGPGRWDRWSCDE